MKYSEYLQIEHKLSSYYDEQWCEGGTYGTCWDEEGPSECSTEPAIDCYSFNDYDKILNLVFNEISNTVRDRYSHNLTISEYSESDYYGGIAEYGNIIFDTIPLLDDVLSDIYGYENMTLEQARYALPELFL